MGLRQAVLKTLLACAFLAAAFHAYSVGETRSAARGNTVVDWSAYEPLMVHDWRHRLSTLLQHEQSNDVSALQKRLALRAPLDPVAFEAALVQAIDIGDVHAAEDFARDVIHRQPRSLSARLFLLSRASRSQAYDEAIVHFERLAVLRSVDQAALIDAIIGVFREAKDWSPLLSYAGESRPLSKELLRDLLNEPLNTQEIEPLVADYPSLQRDYLRRLLREFGHGEAYAAWRRFSGLADRSGEVPFNSRFVPDDALPPYNWFVDSRHAEIQAAGGLFVVYRGTERPLIARQYFSVPSGRYRIVAEARGRMPENGGSLEWVVSCATPKTNLSTVTIFMNKRGEIETFESELIVPTEKCEFQVIELWGRSGTFPQISRTEFLSILIEPEKSKRPE